MLFKSKFERLHDFDWFSDHYSGELDLSHNIPLMKYLMDGGFFTAPASTKYHGAYEGGLYDHSRTVAFRLIELTERNGLKWQRRESPLIVGMFHDLCKCDQYIEKKPGLDLEYEDAPVYEYNPKLLLQGHGAKSVMILSRFLTLTEEEVLAIRYHMGAYEKDDWLGFDLAIRKYETVLYSHVADMLASKVNDV